MILNRYAKQLEKLVVDNSPSILTAIGVTGSITTAILTGKATFKAAEVLATERGRRDLYDEPHAISFKEKVPHVWKLYIPAASSGVLTVVSIIGANRIGTRRAAAMAAAYSLSERAFSEYKEKVVEKLGAKKEQVARDELAQERVDRNPLSSKQVIITGNGDVLCYDTPTGRYFRSNVESIRKTENDINTQVIHDGYCPLSDFYNLLNLVSTPYSEEVGWTEEKMLEIEFSTTMSEDNQPCIAIHYAVIPIRGSKS